jgi:ElaB/YqjD/DUF883 family membrane-anchored ribosome-binding protein
MKMAAVRKDALKKVSWEEGQESAVRLWNQARENGEDLLYQLNRHVRRHPWKAVVVALAAGAVLGLAVSGVANAQTRR